MPKDTRDKVTLSPEAYKALEVEAMLHGDSLKDTASKLILKAACPKCKEILDIMARLPKEHKDITTQEPNVPIAQKTEGPMAQEPKSQTAYAQIMAERRDPPMRQIVVVEKSTSESGPKDPLSQVPNDMIAQQPDVTTSKEPDVTRAEGPNGPIAKRKRLSEDPIALAKLKEMCGLNPKPSLVAMGKELGYSKSTVADNIKKLKDRGELD